MYHTNCLTSQNSSVFLKLHHYRYVPHNDVSVDGLHIRRWSHEIYYYNNYHGVTIAYSIQYCNMLYRFVT